jgi:hypothetical protein
VRILKPMPYPSPKGMIAGNDIHVIVGEFAPLLPDHAFDLLPVPCDLIPVHDLYT